MASTIRLPQAGAATLDFRADPMQRSWRSVKGVALAAVLCVSMGAALATGTLRIAMTASDIPLPNGQTDQGAEGMRFMGYTVFEALIAYDLSSADKPSALIPGLATEWKHDPADKNRWTFKLRPGVKFHDGSAFNAQAVVWNLDKILNAQAEQFDPKQAAQGRGRIPTIKSYKAVGDLGLEITTTEVNALLPFQLAWIVMSSPAQWQAVGKNWDAFLKKPSGTGPWKLETYVPRERAVLARNADYWNKARVPKLDQLVLLPVADASGPCARDRSTGSRRRRRMQWTASRPPVSGS